MHGFEQSRFQEESGITLDSVMYKQILTFTGNLRRLSLLFTYSLGRALRDSEYSIHLLQVKPPFIFGVRLPVSEEIICPDRDASYQGGVSRRPAYGPVKKGVRFVCRAGRNTGSTSGASFVPHPHGGAFLNVRRPMFISVIHDLVAETQGS